MAAKAETPVFVVDDGETLAEMENSRAQMVLVLPLDVVEEEKGEEEGEGERYEEGGEREEGEGEGEEGEEQEQYEDGEREGYEGEEREEGEEGEGEEYNMYEGEEGQESQDGEDGEGIKESEEGEEDEEDEKEAEGEQENEIPIGPKISGMEVSEAKPDRGKRTDSDPLGWGENNQAWENWVDREIPFADRKDHYFNNWLRTTLEHCFYDYGQLRYKKDLSSMQWKQDHLWDYHTEIMPPDHRVVKNFNEVEEIELTDWTVAFGYLTNGENFGLESWKKNSIFQGVDELRHAAVHRRALKTMHLDNAMMLPSMLNDQQRALEVKKVHKLVYLDSEHDVETQKVLQEIFYGRKPCTSEYHVLPTIQTLLEESFFKYAEHKFPNALADRGRAMPEQIELQIWRDILAFHRVKAEDGITSDEARDLIGETINKLRIAATHRKKGEVLHYVRKAITVAICLGDWVNSIEIEIIGEEWFAGKPRRDVLLRFREHYAGKRIPADQPWEWKRRDAIYQVLAFAEREGYQMVPKRYITQGLTYKDVSPGLMALEKLILDHKSEDTASEKSFAESWTSEGIPSNYSESGISTPSDTTMEYSPSENSTPDENSPAKSILESSSPNKHVHECATSQTSVPQSLRSEESRSNLVFTEDGKAVLDRYMSSDSMDESLKIKPEPKTPAPKIIEQPISTPDEDCAAEIQPKTPEEDDGDDGWPKVLQ